MTDLEETVSGIIRGEFPNSMRGQAFFLNSDACGVKFGGADVYGGSAISFPPDRIPGARAITDKCR